MECFEAETQLEPLTNEEALAVIEPYFAAVKIDFLEAGFELCERTRLIVDPSMHDTARHFAACQDDGLKIYIAPEAADRPDTMLMAILAHELGHACDFLYPGQFALGAEDAPAIFRDPASMKSKHWHAWLRDWRRRDHDVVELTADAISHLAMGVRYGYRGPCLIQDLSADRLRPRGLR